MKPMKNNLPLPQKQQKEFIKGIIYDDEIQKDTCINDTIDRLTILNSIIDEIYNAAKCNNPDFIPTKNEFLTSTCIAAMLQQTPENGERNLLIPSQLLDNNLYNRLKKIDIGEQVAGGYIEKTVSDKISGENVEENESSKCGGEYEIDEIDKSGNVVKSMTFNTIREATEWILDQNQKGAIPIDEAMCLLDQLDDMKD